MRAFRKNVALAVDGGGIKGVLVARALAILEVYLGRPVHDIFRLAVGTSTGAIISAGLAAGLGAGRMHDLYVDMGNAVFRRTWRTCLWPLTRYRYESAPLAEALQEYIGDRRMGEFWKADPPTDVVITVFDLRTNHTRFIKPWKEEYANWSVITAVLGSCTVPTYFPVVEGRYVDGGVGSYANPCYVAAYEAAYCLGWDPAETTLLSLGTGRDPRVGLPGEPARYATWDWLAPILGAFLQSAGDQQVHLVRTFFPQMDFRRFQVDFPKAMAMDDPSQIPLLTQYGEEMGQKILRDDTDRALEQAIRRPGQPHQV